MLTLIMCLFQDFMYIIKIHQNKKHNKNKTSNLCRNLEGNERKTIEEEGKLRMEE